MEERLALAIVAGGTGTRGPRAGAMQPGTNAQQRATLRTMSQEDRSAYAAQGVSDGQEKRSNLERWSEDKAVLYGEQVRNRPNNIAQPRTRARPPGG